MNFQWRQSFPNRSSQHKRSPAQSPLSSIRSNSRNVVPSGTVASRVQFLQSLEATAAFPRPPPQVETRHRDNSRTGFGRRLTNRFARPALHNPKPDEEPQVDAFHSYIGLNTPHSNHEEEHGFSDPRATHVRTPGIHGQYQPNGFVERTQHDAAAPWSMPRSISQGVARSSTDFELMKEVDADGNQSHIVAQTSIFPSSVAEENRDMYRMETKSCQAKTLNSESSFATTSSMRRQSVRELFDDYGIERPEGLISSKESSRDMKDTPKPSRPHRYCHTCSWINTGSSIKCWRCAHRLCQTCDELSPMPSSKQRTVLESHEKRYQWDQMNFRLGLPAKESTVIEQEPVKQYTRPVPVSIQPRRKESPSRNRSSAATKFSEYEEPPTAPKSIPRPTQKPSFPDQPVSAIRLETRALSNVKNSPFLMADLSAANQSLRLVPIGMQREAPTKPRSNRGRRTKQSRHGRSSSSDCDCNSPPLRTPEHGRHLQRQATCSKHRHRQSCYIREETDHGYVADTSHVEEADHTHHPFHVETSRPHSLEHSHSSQPHSRLSHSSRPDSHFSYKARGSSYENRVPEYVECSGYPRTGHTRHGSLDDSGMPGQCQHCLEDCQFLACQNTHHNVRCCIHADHHAVLHQHHTPRKEKPALNPSASLKPSMAVVTPDRPLTAIPLPIQGKRTSEKSLAVSANVPMPQHEAPKSNFQEAPSLPISKNSMFMKEASKPPTPPPWVSLPRTTTIPKAESNRAPTDTSLGVEYPGDRPLPFKERPTLPPPATCDQTSPDSTDGQMSPQDSAPVSRRLSALFQLQQISSMESIPPLNQKSQRDKRKLKQIQEEGNQKTGSNGVAELARSIEQKEATFKNEKVDAQSRKVSAGSTASSMGKWKLRLVDKKPSSPCLNDENRTTREHRLFEDEVVHEERHQHRTKAIAQHKLADDELIHEENDGRSNTSREHRLSEDFIVDTKQNTGKRGKSSHVNELLALCPDERCVWKSMFLDEQNARAFNKERKSDLGIKGITIIIHFDDRDDLIGKVTSWDRGGLQM